MVGPSEIVVIGVIVLLLLLLGGRSRRERLPPDSVADGAGDVWEARATIRIPKYFVSVLLALAAAAAVAGAVIWLLQFPIWVGALSGGVVAGAGAAAAMQAGRRSPRR